MLPPIFTAGPLRSTPNAASIPGELKGAEEIGDLCFARRVVTGDCPSKAGENPNEPTAWELGVRPVIFGVIPVIFGVVMVFRTVIDVDGWLVDRFWLRLRTFILSNPRYT